MIDISREKIPSFKKFCEKQYLSEEANMTSLVGFAKKIWNIFKNNNISLDSVIRQAENRLNLEKDDYVAEGVADNGKKLIGFIKKLLNSDESKLKQFVDDNSDEIDQSKLNGGHVGAGKKIGLVFIVIMILAQMAMAANPKSDGKQLDLGDNSKAKTELIGGDNSNLNLLAIKNISNNDGKATLYKNIISKVQEKFPNAKIGVGVSDDRDMANKEATAIAGTNATTFNDAIGGKFISIKVDKNSDGAEQAYNVIVETLHRGIALEKSSIDKTPEAQDSDFTIDLTSEGIAKKKEALQNAGESVGNFFKGLGEKAKKVPGNLRPLGPS